MSTCSNEGYKLRTCPLFIDDIWYNMNKNLSMAIDRDTDIDDTIKHAS